MFKNESISERIKKSKKKKISLNTLYVQDSGINLMDFMLILYKEGYRDFVIETYGVPLKSIRTIIELNKKGCDIKLIVSDTLAFMNKAGMAALIKGRVKHKVSHTHVKTLTTDDIVVFSSGNLEPDGEIEFIYGKKDAKAAHELRQRYERT
jgi:hypothetical protein